MSPTLKKFLITSGLVAAVVAFGLIVARGSGTKPQDASTGTAAPTAAAPAETGSKPESTTGSTPSPESTPAAAPAAPSMGAAALTARVPQGMSAETAPAPIGSLDPAKAPFEIRFSPIGGGVSEILFSDFWTTVDAAREAKAARASGDASKMPGDNKRYILAATRKLQGYDVPALAAHRIEVDGAMVGLFNAWASDAAHPGVFTTEIVTAEGAPVLRIVRSYTQVGSDASNKYLLGVNHAITSLDGKAHTVRLLQYGPGDLAHDPASAIDSRRFHFGYLYPAQRDPTQRFVTANGQMFDRSKTVGEINADRVTMWPNHDAAEGKFQLSWYGSTDRYFALAVHAPFGPLGSDSRALSAVSEVHGITNSKDAGVLPPHDAVFTEMISPAATVDAGATTTLAMGVYAGPLDPTILEGIEPYSSLNMGDIIVYAMGGCCSWCTFAWLANALLWFLSFIHNYLVFDWGFAIIGLVVVVRLVLHPIQKKSQISMQRFSRAMAAMKPELDQLQKKFKDDPQRMQAEQMRMFKERGVSPAGCVGGMLPTFAQMPIWMALYAVLYFAFPLRQQAPFFGVFQNFGNWSFLADLSSPDHFIAFANPIPIGIPGVYTLFSLASINLLPVLMGIVFFIQQKYTAPPVTASTSEDQIAQQKMMKWMMVLMFPLMTYTVPSGLTLYILTSTCIGIIEGRIIKKQVDAMDLSAKPAAGKQQSGFLGRLYEQALERAQQRQQQGTKKKPKGR